ncbi:hypothetical protein BC629DRAFT_1495132 [Irpex lacteus]|nr:hypothetical protein BC629DRAFT_1495132 [Irpex lacteus]
MTFSPSRSPVSSLIVITLVLGQETTAQTRGYRAFGIVLSHLLPALLHLSQLDDLVISSSRSDVHLGNGASSYGYIYREKPDLVWQRRTT